MVGMNSTSIIPHWLQVLLREGYFLPCQIHHYAKKNEKNVFCLSCCTSICSHCLPSHRLHHSLQIRRYVYNDVIRLGDAQKLLNCSLVQPYTTNSAKVVFLKHRPMSRQFRGCGKFCITCNRSLQDPYLFCSLSCKFHHLQTTKKGIWVTISELEEDQMISSSAAAAAAAAADHPNHGVARFLPLKTESVKKKKRSSANLVQGRLYRQRYFPAADKVGVINRRKRTPRRSPLY